MDSSNSDFIPTTDLIKGSPKMMFAYFLLNECKEYLRGMRDPEKINVGTATLSLLAFCPDTATRHKLWASYANYKKYGRADPKDVQPGDVGLDEVEASIFTIGDFNSYLSETLEWTEKSTIGF
jgi:hypothetical protein